MPRFGYLRNAALLVILAVALVPLTAGEKPPQIAQGMSTPATPWSDYMSAPLPGGPAPDLDLVFTSQVLGWIEPCG